MARTENSNFNVTGILERVVSMNASDLHLTVGTPPVVRVNRLLSPLSDMSPLLTEDVDLFLSQVLDADQKDIFDVNRELDFSVGLGNKARFRVNAFYQKGYPSVSLRLIPMMVPSLDTLGLPPVISSLCELRQGLVLVVGPTGHGKSTTLAAMLDRINQTRAEHIVTIEDPIEYIFTNKKSLIEQREMHTDTSSWDLALRAVLRQDPDIVMIGEMRDHETMQAALNIAETGHLVLATLHTNSASQTVERIISSFPEERQNEVRLQLAQIIEVVLSLRLMPSKQGKVVPSVEIMLASEAVKNLIREGKTQHLDNIISTSGNLGMVSLERSLAQLVIEDIVSEEEAIKYALKPEEFRRLLK
ncbi:MAG: PilT/PilU family type 4a pilus ATPase [Patescibacteria group bacterium]|jgi:twitching motility protein PilT